MKTIYKYTLPVKEKCEIELPKNASIIRCEDVDGLFYIWAIVNTDIGVGTEIRYLEFYKTGQPINTPLEHLKFIGTCKLVIMQELCLYCFENLKKYYDNHPF